LFLNYGINAVAIDKSPSIYVINFLIMTFLGCRIVETCSTEKDIFLKVKASEELEVMIFQSKGAGEFAPCEPVVRNCYKIHIPVMDGGYKTFMGFKYSKHILQDYPIIRVVWGKIATKDLSLNDIEKLEKDEKGYSVLIVF
jgi:hypothetical protein